MEDLIALILILFGALLGLMVLWKIFDMIRGTIKGKRNKEYEVLFDKMAHAFIQHKNDMERRVKNIEAIVTNNINFSTNIDSKNKPSIEVDEPDTKVDIQNEDMQISNKVR